MGTWTATLTAGNDATESENRIHADDVARRYGFEGGLVPGVTVYRLMTVPVLDALGEPWARGGSMQARFVRPVYDGDIVVASATGDAAHLDLELCDSSGEVCATGTASAVHAGTAAPDAAEFPVVAAPPKAERPPATADAFAQWPVLGELRFGFHLDRADPDSCVFDIAHPAWLLRAANYVLSGTVKLGPWIHVSSAVSHFGMVRDGDTVSVRARVTDVFERRGHRFVALDAAWFTPVGPVMRAEHVAIYEPRPVRASA